MSTLTPIVRLRVYAPPSVDATELTVLTPAPGAPHGEPFQVATAEGVPGYRALLEMPHGRRGAFDVITKRTDFGELTYRILDQRLGDANAARWLTAFAGDAAGRPILLNCRAVADLSLDGGASWEAFHVGRIEDVTFTDPLFAMLTVRDETDRFDELLFTGAPHASVTYARPPAVLPLQPPPGTIGEYLTLSAVVDYGVGWAGYFVLNVDESQTPVRGNVVSDGLARIARYETPASGFQRHRYTYAPRINRSTTGTPDYGVGASTLRARLRWSGGSGDFAVSDVWVKHSGSAPDSFYRAVFIGCWELPSGDLGYAARPSNGTAVKLTLIADTEASTAAPLIITGADPLTLWQDVLAGKFSRLLSTGAVRRTIPFDAAAFAALAATRTFLPIDAVLTKPLSVSAFIEQFILRPNHLGYRMSPAGEVVPFDCRRETSLTAVPALGVDALASLADGFDWRQRRSDAVASIAVTTYVDFVANPQEEVANKRGPVLASPAGGIRSFEREVVDLDVSARGLDVAGGTLDIAAPGWRARSRLVGEEPDAARTEAINAAVVGLATQLRILVGRGATALSRAFRRQAAGDVYPGMWRRLTIAEAPNAATYQRAGERLALCVDRVEDGPVLTLSFLDGGAVVLAATPTLASLSVDDQIPRVVVTLNAAGDPVLLEYQLTATSVGSAPAGGWRQAGVQRATGAYSLPRVPRGVRLWVRGRSEPEVAATSDFRLPSAFVAPSPAYIDTGTITAPSGVAVSELAANAATVTWTPGDAEAKTEILLALGSFSAGLFDDPALIVAELPAGAVRFRLVGLDGPSVAHCVGVRHLSVEDGGRSTVATANFTTGTVNATRARPAGLAVLPSFG